MPLIILLSLLLFVLCKLKDSMEDTEERGIARQKEYERIKIMREIKQKHKDKALNRKRRYYGI